MRKTKSTNCNHKTLTIKGVGFFDHAQRLGLFATIGFCGGAVAEERRLGEFRRIGMRTIFPARRRVLGRGAEGCGGRNGGKQKEEGEKEEGRMEEEGRKGGRKEGRREVDGREERGKKKGKRSE